ncbi:MAG: class I SAM-dependent methyltransferase [Rhodospirillales bacterium]|jgi:tetratricopeptide (TPR) repeat protein
MTQTAENLFAQGMAHFKAYRAHRAVACFERLRQIDPDFPHLDIAYLKALRRDARHAQALSFGEAAKGDPSEIGFEAAMCRLALGQAEAALRDFDAVLAQRPDMAVAWQHSHAPALELLGLDEAMRRIDRALACSGPVNGNYVALLAAYRWLQGDRAAANGLARKGRHRLLIEGLAALEKDFSPDPQLFAVSASLHGHAMRQAHLKGLVLEFGVRRGTSLRHIAAIAHQEAHGFDSFEGLPEGWGSAGPGLLSTECELPDMPPNVHLHPGWFEDTLPPFLASHPRPVRFLNIDSDLYSSARTVLFALAPRLIPGSVVVFDELIGNPTWRQDEFKALLEFAQAFKACFKIFALSLATKQVGLRIL